MTNLQRVYKGFIATMAEDANQTINERIANDLEHDSGYYFGDYCDLDLQLTDVQRGLIESAIDHLLRLLPEQDPLNEDLGANLYMGFTHDPLGTPLNDVDINGYNDTQFFIADDDDQIIGADIQLSIDGVLYS